MTLETPEEFARRLELCKAWRAVRYAEAYGRLHPGSDCAVQQIGSGYAVFISKESPVGGARGIGMAGPVDISEIEAMEDFFFRRGVAASLHVCPLADPSLFEILNRRGYRLSYFFSVLARPIPADFQPKPLPEGMRVARAEPSEGSLWLRVSAQGFSEEEEPASDAFEILGPNFSAEDGVPYLAWCRDEAGGWQAAGCGGMYLAPMVRALELGGASTRVAFRRRGVQRALIEARLAEGLRQGCDLAIVLTEPGSNSQRNLQRTGFSLAYTKPVMEKTPDG